MNISLGNVASHFEFKTIYGKLFACTPDLKIWDDENEEYKTFQAEIPSKEEALIALIKTFEELPVGSQIKSNRAIGAEEYKKTAKNKWQAAINQSQLDTAPPILDETPKGFS